MIASGETDDRKQSLNRIASFVKMLSYTNLGKPSDKSKEVYEAMQTLVTEYKDTDEYRKKSICGENGYLQQLQELKQEWDKLPLYIYLHFLEVFQRELKTFSKVM